MGTSHDAIGRLKVFRRLGALTGRDEDLVRLVVQFSYPHPHTHAPNLSIHALTVPSLSHSIILRSPTATSPTFLPSQTCTHELYPSLSLYTTVLETELLATGILKQAFRQTDE